MVFVMINFKVNQLKMEYGYCEVFEILKGVLYDL